MTPLRSRLIEEITLRNYSPRTTEAYVHAVYSLAQHYHRSPDTLSDPEVRQYLLHLHLNTGKAASTLNVAVSGLRFFYQRVLHREFYHLEQNLPRPRQPKRRPKAYSLREVRKLINACTHPKHRAFLVTIYGAGLRLNEGCHLRPEHIERDQRLIRVEQGKGRKDRYTVLPDSVLRELENYWRLCRPPRPWLFPSSRQPDQPMSDGTAQKIFYAAVARAGLPDKGGIHCLRHSFATHWTEAGLPLFVLKRMLGHNSLSTTCKYVHPSREYLAKVKSPLDSLYEHPPGRSHPAREVPARIITPLDALHSR